MLLLLGVLAATPAEPGARLDAAISLYETARFAQAKEKLTDLVEAPGLDATSRARARTYLAATHLALKDKASARRELRILAREQPEAKPSPATFPPEVIALANEVWAEAEKFRAEAKTAEPGPAPLVVIEPANPPQPPAPIVSAPADEELSKPAPPRALALLPLGIGHFARGAIALGVVWLVLETVLFSVSIGTVAELESKKVPESNPQFLGSGACRADQCGTMEALNWTSTLTLIAGLVVAVADIITANIGWPGDSQ